MNLPINRGVLILLLAISILFNLFFVLGLMQARMDSPQVSAASLTDDGNGARTEEAVRRVGDTLELDAAQREVFASLHRSVLEDRADVRRSEALLRQQLMEALSREEIDPQQVRDLVLRQLDAERRHRAFAAQRFSEFLGTLDPPQRNRIRRDVERIVMPSSGRPSRTGEGRSRRGMPSGDHEGPPRWLLEQFDRDGDGRLNDEERAEAERFLEDRRREREMRRADIMRRFDLDGDGRLNAEERRAMQRWLQEQREREREKSDDADDA